ncbi:MmgE/PrpD family protein [Phenylobacterium soli]|uniref:MmgE/PrpD family protein n=1 Tax=Phenylobacterium soli TaxID=2170551 RepID=A0A328AB05_9CAUL|nr:MmgE/PrpD family protein [Phenylobacterium soli]RAK51791.1 MmgE/PrpD family protein [Phenylobacterium soli]
MTALSRRIAEHVAGARFEALPAAAVEATKRSLLDALGVTLGASRMGEGCQAFVDLARSAGAGRPESTILGFGDKVAAPLAALANGAMAHALDYEDAYDEAPLHPNAIAVPAVLAEAEAMGGVPGARLLTALAVGCDLTCRMGLALTSDPADFGWYPPPILGAYGATAAVAHLRGLSADQVLDALSLTLCQATTPGEIKYSPGSTVRAVRDAFGAQAAVQSVRLAAAGIKGFEAPLEGRAGFFELYARGGYDPAVLTDGLGERFLSERVSFKVWPSCRGTHAYIEAALGLMAAHGFGADEVAAVDLGIGPIQRMLVEPAAQKRAPVSPINAKFSLPYTVACALVRGRVGLDDFGPESLADPAILAMAGRVSWREVEGWGAAEAASGELTLRLTSGQALKGRIERARGAPDNPVSREELIAKFEDCAGRAVNPLSRSEARGWVEAVFALEAAPDAARAILG